MNENKPQSRYKEVDLSRLKTFRIDDLERKVNREQFASPLNRDSKFEDFIRSLPDILKANELRMFAGIIADAVRSNHAIIVMFGGHVIKTGLATLLIDWFKRGRITALATHGAGCIHDTEIALFGRTSEDVAEGLADGSFGMSRDTADFINYVIANPKHEKLGYGEALGKALIENNVPYADLSLLASAYKAGIPLTAHVALGSDIIHQHPSCNGEAVGRASMRDFRIFAHEVGKLSKGGVVINLGSAVIMPEVFLKALSVARNLGSPAHGFTAANFDMNIHYRPMLNVLDRPTMTGGRKFNFVGHHEIMIPLLFAMVNEKINE
ncbi:hypothetical protein K9N50_13010 [bacterium]|nr:hypothetical protein [bacterium]